jgi:hypothetical protein
MNTRAVSNLHGGVYLIYFVSGNVVVNVRRWFGS